MLNFKNYRRIYSVFFLILACLSLSSCNEQGCIEADDFGYPTINVPANINTPGSTTYIVSDNNFPQVTTWLNTGLILDGNPLTLVVDGHSQVNAVYYYPTDNPNISPCIFKNDDITMLYPANPIQAWILNPPCHFKSGLSLYGMVTNPDSKIDFSSQNAKLSDVKYPSKTSAGAINFHINNTKNDLFTRQSNPSDPGNFLTDNVVPAGSYNQNVGKSGGNLYFKILNNHYTSVMSEGPGRTGSYNVLVKSGASYPSTGIFTKIIDVIQDKVSMAYKKVFEGIIGNPSFQNGVKIAAIIYLAGTALGFTVGLIQITAYEFMIRSIRLGIVFALINTTYSWSFFSNYLFDAIIHGPDELISIITGSQDTSQLIDNMLRQLFNHKTFGKISALISVTGFIATIISLLFVLLLILFMIFIFFAIIKLAIAYILSLLAIALLIGVAPFFIAFYLFEYTRSLFDSWLGALLAFTLQPVLCISFLYFCVQFVMKKFTDIVGYRVCYTSRDFWGGPIKITKYHPQISPLEEAKQVIAVPGNWINENGFVCQPYQCSDLRYVDLPYFDLSQPTYVERIKQIFGGVEHYQTCLFDLVIFGFFAYVIKEISTNVIDKIAYEISSAFGGAQQSASTLSDRASMIFANNPANVAASYAGAKAKEKISKGMSAASASLTNLRKRTTKRIRRALIGDKGGRNTLDVKSEKTERPKTSEFMGPPDKQASSNIPVKSDKLRYDSTKEPSSTTSTSNTNNTSGTSKFSPPLPVPRDTTNASQGDTSPPPVPRDTANASQGDTSPPPVPAKGESAKKMSGDSGLSQPDKTPSPVENKPAQTAHKSSEVSRTSLNTPSTDSDKGGKPGD